MPLIAGRLLLGDPLDFLHAMLEGEHDGKQSCTTPQDEESQALPKIQQ
jgi:hypothetical protein